MNSDFKKYLVTGANGMLGAVMVDCLHDQGCEVVGVDIEDADLTKSEAVAMLLNKHKPTQIIHCAAYTNVDAAEQDAQNAQTVNVEATRNLAHVANRIGAAMLMISTDFVFDGKAHAPYPTNVPTNPQGVYACTKREAEIVLAEELDRHQILRTAWLFGPGGRGHFVRTILQRLENSQPLQVVNDQIGSPTYTKHLAPALIALT